MSSCFLLRGLSMADSHSVAQLSAFSFIPGGGRVTQNEITSWWPMILCAGIMGDSHCAIIGNGV